MLLEERQEARRADLLLALDEDRHAHRQVAQRRQRPQRTHVRDDPRLVVRGATPEQTTVDLGRDERVGVPRGSVSRGLHVVVRVEQDRRGARRSRAARDDRGRTERAGDPGRVQDLHLGQARPAQGSATASALAATCAWSNAELETDGMRTSASRSPRSAGKSSATRARR